MTTSTGTPHIRAAGISKSYGGVAVLHGIDLEIEAGQIHAIVGENGAGKSTFGKILAGVTTPSSGTILIDGVPARLRNPREALTNGIAFVHQEISLVPSLSVLQNVFLGAEDHHLGIVGTAAMGTRLRELSAYTGFELPADTPVAQLPPAEQQKVEIVRALARNARLIIFDEPTAPLTRNEAETLHAVLRRLRDRGTAILFVSHFLDEVLEVADTVSVFKDGSLVTTRPTDVTTPENLIVAMLGRALDSVFPLKQRPASDAPVALRVRGLSRSGAVSPASIEVRAGEIVGVAGIVGSGRTELTRLIYGADKSDGGSVEIGGKQVRIRNPRDAIRHGIAYVPESRKDQGLILSRSVKENLTLPSVRDLSGAGLIASRSEMTLAQQLIGTIDLRPPEPDRVIGSLSGGNQQKVLFGRWLAREPRVLIADEPTRGVDVGAKHALYELLVQLAQRGTAVLFVSSELEEITGLAHRIYVMRKGSVVAELGGDATDDRILAAAFGRNTGDGGAAHHDHQ